MSTLVISNYLENALINHILRNTGLTAPTSVYLALYTSDPTDADTGVEVTGGSYVREQLTAAFSTPASGAIQNSALIEFVAATAVWGLVTHIGIRDAATLGNLLYYGALTTGQQVDTGDVFKIAAGDLDVLLTNHFSHFLANELLDHTLNGAAWATPGTSLYMALFTTTPARDGTGGVEVSGGSYARKQVTAWDVPSNGVSANTNIEAHAVATADWGTILGGALMTALTAGNHLFINALVASRIVYNGDTFQWAAGAIDVSVD